MATERSEGIILQTLKYQDDDQIATVFTHDKGILKFFVKGAYRSKNALGSPLTRAEFIYLVRQSHLHNCREVSLLNTYHSLRTSLSYLETALEMIKAVLESQLENQPAPHLYQLLVVYLEKIPLMPDPLVLAASFHLKVLRHDGLLNFEQGGFNEEEKLLIQLLTLTRSFKDLTAVALPEGFYPKVRAYFKTCL